MIIDTPPVLAVTDASIVGALAGTTLMVARFGMNTIKEIDVACNRFGQSGIEVKGVILNATEKKHPATMVMVTTTTLIRVTISSSYFYMI